MILPVMLVLGFFIFFFSFFFPLSHSLSLSLSLSSFFSLPFPLISIFPSHYHCDLLFLLTFFQPLQPWSHSLSFPSPCTFARVLQLSYHIKNDQQFFAFSLQGSDLLSLCCKRKRRLSSWGLETPSFGGSPPKSSHRALVVGA